MEKKIKTSKYSKETKARMVYIGCILCLFASLGCYSGTYSMYIVPLSAKLGVSVAAVGYVYTVSGLVSFILASQAGRVMSKLNLHYTVLLGGVGVGLAFLITRFATNIIMIYVAGVFLAFGAIFAGYTVVQTAITKWFSVNRATLSGFAGAGEAAGTTFFSFLAAFFFNQSPDGYQTSAIVTAIVGFVLVAFAGLVLMRGFPEEYGFTPIGFEKVQMETSSNQTITEGELPGISSKDAMKTPKLWLLLLSTLMVMFASYLYVPQQASFLGGQGYPMTQVAVFISVYTWSKVLNKILFGFISDKFGLRMGIAYSTLFFIVGFVLLILTMSAPNMILVYIATICVGMGTGLGGNYGTLVMAKFFGPKDITKLGPLPHSSAAFGSFMGPVVFGVIFSISEGSYTPVLITAIVLLVVFFVLIMGITNSSNYFEKEGLKKEVQK